MSSGSFSQLEAVDDSWQQIQTTTFTNWFNNRLRGNLKESPYKINNLFEDLKDGILLSELVIKLANTKSVGSIMKQPKFKSQCLENIGVTLEYLKTQQKVRLVNIGPEDIYSGNQKLILGLIWTLIKTFQIKSSGKKVSTKKAMLAWINIQIPMYKITNFHSDWNNGKALCGLVEQIKPGICANHMGLDKTNGLENCIMGMDLAEKHLKVPQVLFPADMNNPMVDELSVMTYLSFFFGPANERLVQWLKQKLPEKKITNLNTDWNNGTNLPLLINRCYADLMTDHATYTDKTPIDNLKRVFQVGEDNLGISCLVSAKEFSSPDLDELVAACYLWSIKLSDRKAKGLKMTGEFVDGGGLCRVNEPSTFYVQGARSASEVKIQIQGPQSDPKPQVTPFDGNKVAVTFTPLNPGNYTVFGTYTGANIPGSPVTIQAADPSKLEILSEIPNSLQVGEIEEIFVKSNNVGPGKLLAKSSHPRFLDVNIVDQENNSFVMKLKPLEVGDCKVEITWSGLAIAVSPLKFAICDARKASAFSKNLSSKSGKVGEEFEMTVQGRYAGNVKPKIYPKGYTTEPTVVLEEISQGTYKAAFVPTEVGAHEIKIFWGRSQVPNSPFEALIAPAASANLCNAHGDGLKRCQATVPAHFNIVGNQQELMKEGHLKVHITDMTNHPIDAKLKVVDQMDSSYGVTYTVPEVGTYLISIAVIGEQIPGSPFTLIALPPALAGKCRAYGSAIDPSVTKLTGQTLEFNVDTREAGTAELTTHLRQPDDSTGRVFTANDGKGVYSVKFDAPMMGRFKVAVKWAGTHIPGSPFVIKVFQGPNASKVHAYGPGLEDGIAGSMGEFYIDTNNAGMGTLTIRVHGVKGAFKIDAYAPDDAKPRDLTARYDPQIPAIYTISIRWSGEHVPGSPYRVEVMDPDFDAEYEEDYTRVQQRRIAQAENMGPLADDFAQMSPNYGARRGYNFSQFRNSGVSFNEGSSMNQKHVDDNFYLQGGDGASYGSKQKKKGFGWFKQSSSVEGKDKRGKAQTAFKVRASSFGKSDNVSYTRTRHHRRVVTQPQQVMYSYPPYYSPQPYGHPQGYYPYGYQ